ncbi:MAG: hypothetical protein M3171_14390, partial [Actinomycetota bacterium]|nr:hypothetical protein [Actinomycetota bacterium]
RTQLQGPASEWALWSTTMRVVTEDSHALPSARRLIDGGLARVELAASRFSADFEVGTLPASRQPPAASRQPPALRPPAAESASAPR